MLKFLLLTLVLGSIPSLTLSSSRGSHDANSHGPPAVKTRFQRENLYNFRPQSAVIEDELEYRSYDNNFGPIYAANNDARGNYGYKPTAAPSFTPAQPLAPISHPSYLGTSLAPHFPSTYRDVDEDYNDDLDLPEEDEVDPGFRNFPSPPHSYSKRRPGGARPAPPNPPVLAQWDDQSGRQRGDGSYSFGFRLPDQSRRESSDVFGNVNGDFSFVDDEGTFRKIVYSAGAHKGFVVNSKIPTDTQLPNSPRRPQHHRKPIPNPIILTEVPRVFPTKTPVRRPSSKPHRQVPPRNREQTGSSNDNRVGVPGTATILPSRRPPLQLPNAEDARQAQNPGNVNLLLNPSPEDQQGNAETGVNGNEGNNNTGKPWGVLGQNPSSRPRVMRKRKPSLVVKVKRPASTTAAPPAWVYYRPPNPRPLAGAGANTWDTNDKKASLPAPTPSPYPEEDPSDDNASDSWTDESENEIDPYPKDKSYSFGYSTGDQQRQEVSDAWGNIRGSYSYVDPAGVTRTVHYTAGNSGFKVLNAQPSNVRPVAIPIPVPVMSRLQQFAEAPQPSAIVYHIHPTNGVGASWKPWESQKVVKSSPYTSRRRRRQRPRQQIVEPQPQSTTVQGNTFHLTPANDKFFPAFTNVYGSSSSSRTSKLSEARPITRNPSPEYEDVITDDPEFLRYLQHQYTRQKLRALSRQQKLQTHQPYIQYQPYYSPRPKSSSAIRLQNLDRLTNYFITEPGDDSLGVYDDKIYSDYEIAAAIVEAENARLGIDSRKGRKSRKHHHHSKRGKNSRHNPHTVTQDPDNAESIKISQQAAGQLELLKLSATMAPSEVTTADKFGMHGDMEIHGYKGGYGDKHPLLVITQMPDTTTTSLPVKSTMKPSPSTATRPQRQAPMSTSLERMAMLSNEKAPIMDNLMAESMQPTVAEPLMMIVMASNENKNLDMLANSASNEGGEKKLTTSGEANGKMSPAARLAARMASAQTSSAVSSMSAVSASSSITAVSSTSSTDNPPKGGASISAIPTMISNSGKLMHFPGGILEPLHPAFSSKENAFS